MAETQDQSRHYRRIARYFGVILAALLIALALRTFLFAPFSIPSESMQPTLFPGDHILVHRWGYGAASFGVADAQLPERGAVVVFRGPGDGRHYVKRVIGHPGDRVAIRDGRIWLNGARVPRVRLDDLVVPASPSAPGAGEKSCHFALYAGESGRVGDYCRLPRFAERLPGGRIYATLDLARGANGDDIPPLTVAPGHVFVLGDHRDRSVDSRRWPGAKTALGQVPLSSVEGEARYILFSIDRAARIEQPGQWFDAVRWNRVGSPVDLPTMGRG